jgi:hypothetical protein
MKINFADLSVGRKAGIAAFFLLVLLIVYRSFSGGGEQNPAESTKAPSAKAALTVSLAIKSKRVMCWRGLRATRWLVN